MENTYQDLANRVSEAALSCKKNRLLVAVAGAPGSGKTMIATEVMKLINSKGNEAAPG
jgi:ABC-type dipeptide/oligopeptide/nickel transport system ATPase component